MTAQQCTCNAYCDFEDDTCSRCVKTFVHREKPTAGWVHACYTHRHEVEAFCYDEGYTESDWDLRGSQRAAARRTA